MPKWGASWGKGQITTFLDADPDSTDQRDLNRIYNSLSMIGVVESAEPSVLLFAVRQVIHTLLAQRDAVLELLAEDPPDVYPGLLKAAFRMEELTTREDRAFWISGYEADRQTLLETMRRCQLPPDAPDYELAPHLHRQRFWQKLRLDQQAVKLHQLSQSGRFGKDLRKKLYAIGTRQVPATAKQPGQC